MVDLESGKVNPKLGDLVELARVLGADLGVLLGLPGEPSTEALKVAIAVVADGTNTLLVCRRDDAGALSWQFPAGIIKPGENAELVAVREVLDETGVHCAVRRSLGARVHPVTRVHCTYFLCDYLAGVIENRDTVENVAVTWAEQTKLTDFIAHDRIFPPILDAMDQPGVRLAVR